MPWYTNFVVKTQVRSTCTSFFSQVRSTCTSLTPSMIMSSPTKRCPKVQIRTRHDEAFPCRDPTGFFACIKYNSDFQRDGGSNITSRKPL